MKSECEHWLTVTDDLEWRRTHIHDPNIPLGATLEALAFDAPKRILEIGCGYGRLTTEIAKRYPDAHVTGIDINPKILPDSGNITYMCQGNLDGLPTQDAIYSVALFQHLPSDAKRAYIAAAAGLLNPGGVLRVQFIEGVRNNWNDHWAPVAHMRKWCMAAGLSVTAVDQRVAHPQWTWITGTK